MPLQLFIALILSLVASSHCDYAADEAALIAAIKANSTSEARPSATVYVVTNLAIFALNSVDIGSEVMSLSGVLASFWMDPRLTWDPATHGGIGSVLVPKSVLWTPALVIENEITKVGVLGSDGTPIRVRSDGGILWSPPISSTTSCSADITYYPYDKQTCSIVLIGWSYTVDEVDVIVTNESPINQRYYSPSGEWELRTTGVEYENLTDGVDVFRKIKFNFTFRRRWPYYGQNVILPIILNSILMAMVFTVPINSGEKMGYCLTVLLSYIVLLTIVSDDLPSISSQTSVIQMYLSIVMCIGTCSTICTIAVLQANNQQGKTKPVPAYLQFLVTYIIAPVACKSCKKRRVASLGDNNFPNKDKRTDEEDSTSYKYSWQEIAVMLDKFFFVTCSTILIVLTSCVVILLLANYD